MENYLPIIVPLILGMGVFTLLRRRNTNPVVSGMAAMFLSIALVVAYFAYIIAAGV